MRKLSKIKLDFWRHWDNLEGETWMIVPKLIPILGPNQSTMLSLRGDIDQAIWTDKLMLGEIPD